MTITKAARYFCYIVASLSLTAGSPFFNVGTNTNGASIKNKNSANALNPILPAKTQPQKASVFTAQQPKSIKFPAPTSRSSTAVRNSSKAQPLQGAQPKLNRRSPGKKYETHPCNLVHDFESSNFETVDKKAGNKKIRCHRLSESELIHKGECAGALSEEHTATSFEQAIKNAQQRTQPKKQRRKANKNQRSKRNKLRAKRNSDRSDINPGTWDVCNCLPRHSTDPMTGLGMPCGTCSTIYRQNTTNRFPEYVNGVICHPNEEELVYDYSGNAIGRCVQQSFTQGLLEWNGQWKKDIIQSTNLGFDVYVEKWDKYEQVIKSSCVFQFFVV